MAIMMLKEEHGLLTYHFGRDGVCLVQIGHQAIELGCLLVKKGLIVARARKEEDTM